MKVTSVTIENLGPITDPVTVPLEDGITVLHGANNAGKSTLLVGVCCTLWLLGFEPETDRDDGGATEPDEGSDVDPDGMDAAVAAFLDRVAPAVTSRTFPVEPSPEAFRRLRPHATRAERPIRLTAHGDQDVHFELTRTFKGFHVTRSVDAAPGGPSWRLVSAARGATEAEAALIVGKQSGERIGNRRFKDVQHALRQFVAELGDGELTIVKRRRDDEAPDASHDEAAKPAARAGAEPAVGDAFELAWETPDGASHRFSDQGSGLRSLKDILVVAYGSDADVLVLEEPEVHLSTKATSRLHDLLGTLAHQGRRLLLSSHVYDFDGPSVYRVVRAADGRVTLRQDDAAALPAELPATDVEARTRKLREQYATEGRPFPGFVSQDGITKLPSELTEELKTPALVTWIKVKDGVYGMAAERIFDDEGDDGGESEDPS